MARAGATSAAAGWFWCFKETVTLRVDLKALASRFVYSEATNGGACSERLTGHFETGFGLVEAEISSKGELLFLNHSLIGGKEELLWSIEVSKHY